MLSAIGMSFVLTNYSQIAQARGKNPYADHYRRLHAA